MNKNGLDYVIVQFFDGRIIGIDGPFTLEQGLEQMRTTLLDESTLSLMRLNTLSNHPEVRLS